MTWEFSVFIPRSDTGLIPLYGVWLTVVIFVNVAGNAVKLSGYLIYLF